MVISSISFDGKLLLTHTMCVRHKLRAHKLFCRRDELSAAWKIFTPVLHAIDRGELVPSQYQAGKAQSVAPNTLACVRKLHSCGGYLPTQALVDRLKQMSWSANVVTFVMITICGRSQWTESQGLDPNASYSRSH